MRLAAALCVCGVVERIVSPRLARALKAPSSASASASGLGPDSALASTVGSVLDRVVVAAAADSEADVRRAVFAALGPSSDPLLLRSPASLSLLGQVRWPDGPRREL